jgi:hypothetical protein
VQRDQGGGGAGLEDYWNAMRAAPNSGGMFIWSLLDEGIVRDDQNGVIDVAGYQAPDGILGPYREKEASYYTVKAIWSPVQIAVPNLTNFTGTVTVENRFDFTDLNECTFRWQLGWFPDPTNSARVLNTGFIATAIALAHADELHAVRRLQFLVVRPPPLRRPPRTFLVGPGPLPYPAGGVGPKRPRHRRAGDGGRFAQHTKREARVPDLGAGRGDGHRRLRLQLQSTPRREARRRRNGTCRRLILMATSTPKM